MLGYNVAKGVPMLWARGGTNPLKFDCNLRPLSTNILFYTAYHLF